MPRNARQSGASWAGLLKQRGRVALTPGGWRTPQPSLLMSNPAPSIPDGLTGMHKMAEIVWPDEAARPSTRTIQSMTKRRVIPFIPINGRAYFEPLKVLDALRKNEVKAAA